MIRRTEGEREAYIEGFKLATEMAAKHGLPFLRAQCKLFDDMEGGDPLANATDSRRVHVESEYR